MNVAAAGLTPTFPVTADAGTVEIPLLARITKPPAAPRSTPASERPPVSAPTGESRGTRPSSTEGASAPPVASVPPAASIDEPLESSPQPATRRRAKAWSTNARRRWVMGVHALHVSSHAAACRTYRYCENRGGVVHQNDVR